MTTVLIRPQLARLALHPELVTARRLWRALSPLERRDAASALLSTNSARHAASQASLRQTVAQARRLRAQTVMAFPIDKLALAASGIENFDDSVIKAAIEAWHLADRIELLRVFLAAAAIPHENGSIPEGWDLAESANLAAGLKAIAERFDGDQVTIYVCAQRITAPPSLATIARMFAKTLEPGQAAPEPEAESAAEPRTDDLSEVPDEFTTLDRRLIRVIVDVAQDVTGAPDEDQLNDLIDEVVQLNSERHRSFFHFGFRDALFGLPLRSELPAENEIRRSWYLAGHVTGLERRSERAAILALFDAHPGLRHLGKGERGPSRAGARIVFRVLTSSGRFAEAAEFVNSDTLINCPGLPTELLDSATDLVRRNRPAEAKALLRHLPQFLAELAARGVDVPSGFRYRVRRRVAHCHRLLGERSEASEILLELLRQSDLDPTHRSQILADLGLLAVGVCRLADLTIPTDAGRINQFREMLELGRARFEEAANVAEANTSHADYCLGLLAALKGDWVEAARRLDSAVTEFGREPDTYRIGDTLGHAKLYRAVVICQGLDLGAMARAVELLHEAQGDGVRAPGHLVQSMLDGLTLADDDLAVKVAESALENAGVDVLDELTIGPNLRRSRALATALLKRALDARRGLVLQVRDAQCVLPMLLHQGRMGDAGDAFDVLDSGAMGRVGVDEFLDLVAHGERTGGVLTVEEALWAAVRCFRVSGRYDEAASLLVNEFHSGLADQDFAGIQLAEDILDELDSFGATALSAELRPRFEAARIAVARPPVARKPYRVEILFVGGNETQAQYASAITADLRASHPHISVKFIHTGWSSNWAVYLDDVRRRLATTDAVVISRLMRTTLGRRVREALNAVPWRGCGGTGKRAMIAAIVAADEAAQSVFRARVGTS